MQYKYYPITGKHYLKLEWIFKIFMLRLDGDLWSVDGQNFALQVHQLALNDLHVVAGREVVRKIVFLGRG